MSKKPKNEDKKLTEIYERFVDILFAVVVGQSFVFLQSDLVVYIADPIGNLFEIATLILIYALIISSWIGYHLSLAKYPMIKPWRFFIDIWLLFVYYLVIIYSTDLLMLLWLFATSFFSYSAWDLIRIFEYRNKKELKKLLLKRLIYSLIFSFLFLMLNFIYLVMNNDIFKWVCLVVSFIFLFAYRLIKWKIE